MFYSCVLNLAAPIQRWQQYTADEIEATSTSKPVKDNKLDNGWGELPPLNGNSNSGIVPSRGGLNSQNRIGQGSGNNSFGINDNKNRSGNNGTRENDSWTPSLDQQTAMGGNGTVL